MNGRWYRPRSSYLVCSLPLCSNGPTSRIHKKSRTKAMTREGAPEAFLGSGLYSVCRSYGGHEEIPGNSGSRSTHDKGSTARSRGNKFTRKQHSSSRRWSPKEAPIFYLWQMLNGIYPLCDTLKNTIWKSQKELIPSPAVLQKKPF